MALLSDLFGRMEHETLALCHSDDMSASLVTKSYKLYFNIDISSCDSSTSLGIFELLLSMVPADHRMHVDRLVEQCRLPCVIGYGEGKMKFKPKIIFEYSGSLLTTLLNTISSFLIMLYVFRFREYESRADAIRIIKDSLYNCGWKCSLEIVDRFEKVQFLKCSPARSVTGRVVSCLNLGVLVRAYGQKTFDLPGRGDLSVRISKFMRAWTMGLRFAGNHVITDMLRAKHVPQGPAAYNSNAIERLEDGVGDYISSYSLCERYDLSLYELEELVSLWNSADIGYTMECSASNKILMLDYGLSNSSA